MTKREVISWMGYDDSIVYDSPDYDDAIIGVDEAAPRVVYDYEKMVAWMMEQDNCSREEAEEFIEYNSTSLPQGGPLIMYPIWEIERNRR